jgi:hypothetical protein
VPQISPLIILKRGNQYNALAVKKVKILMPRTNILYLPKPKQFIATKAFFRQYRQGTNNVCAGCSA